MLVLGRVTGQWIYFIEGESVSQVEVVSVRTEEAIVRLKGKGCGPPIRSMKVGDSLKIPVGDSEVGVELVTILSRPGDGKLRASFGFQTDRRVRIIRRELYEREIRSASTPTPHAAPRPTPKDSFSEGIL